ncbi:MAG: ATPase [Gammaproteobacteria bacterium CG_4_10_14_0_8_um_filter_38_16]|nr:MAG: ATPase [Gammaproteobacteria bacterium CG_4_10_14_0_8_um_filter_38_16]PJA03605.1 MAG: ATPase [Gammaproteobacteria bacterium CG_4_10_14_0_2_um_filter_38_22]PJB10464.1 MAG: ATPase [Gammaproteobacteria bacterium CG_4_9_14_3_um_filter_38_9]
MYNDFYQLKENPFNVTADSSFFFPSTAHSEAFSHLVFGIEQRKGIIAITGEIGTGKTTLCRTLLNSLTKEVKTAFILNPKFSDEQLLQIITQDLAIPGKFENKFELVSALNQFLLTESSQGHNVVIIIDEAQNLSADQLENIRLLSNIETEKEKLLQIVLVGQPELQKKLQLSELRQLNQRISVRYHIHPLNKKETCEYIHHRLKLASNTPYTNSPIAFTNSAMRAIYSRTGGKPRMINILCDRLLLSGFVNGTYTIRDRMVRRCAKELFLT